MKSDLFRFLKRATRDGLWPLFQRYSVFPRILDQPSVQCSSVAEQAIHVLVCEKDAVMLHWCLRSLLLHTKTPLKLYIHDDGSCRAESLDCFRERFRNATVLSRQQANAVVESEIAGHPELLEWRRADHIAAKCIDFYLIGSEPWIVVLDADVLFFAEPKDLLDPASGSGWMEDCFYSPWIDPEEAKEIFGVIPRPISGGLGRMPKRAFDPELLKKVLKFKAQPHILERARSRGLPPLEDQTYHALLAAKNDARILGSEYQVMSESGLQNVVAKHYTTPTRFYFYEEGIPRVAKQIGIPLPLWLRERH